MRHISQLSINAFTARPTRSTLLALAVALSTALVASVSCALASLNSGMELRVNQTLGRADLALAHISNQRFPSSVYEDVLSDPAITHAAPRLEGALGLSNGSAGASTQTAATGIDPIKEAVLIDRVVISGRSIAERGEIELSEVVANRLEATLGDSLDVLYFGAPINLTVVGIYAEPINQFIEQPRTRLHIDDLSQAIGFSGQLSAGSFMVKEDADPRKVAERLQPALPKDLLIEPAAKITAGVQQNIQANRFFFVLISALSFGIATFIILTGLTTNVLERQRELAIMRCIGGTRSQLAGAQIGLGAIIGTLGGAAGIPIGIFLAWIIAVLYPDKLPAGLVLSYGGLLGSFGATLAAGIAGALLPARAASRTHPLDAMRPRASAAPGRSILGIGLAGAACLGMQILFMHASSDVEIVFYSYMFVGLPLMFVGYFFIAVPIVAVLARVLTHPVAKIYKLPANLPGASLAGSPFRSGFTAAALMLGLAHLVATWTSGNALINNYLNAIEFPDAFVRSFSPLTPRDQQAINDLPYVVDTVAMTELKVDPGAFGIEGFRSFKSSFIAFEPEPFFDMVALDFVAGDPEHAMHRMIEGGAVLVAKEFLVFRPDFAVGNMIELEHAGSVHAFEIVGAVNAPGLDIVSKFFDVGKEQADFAVHSIFGSRKDLIERFNTDAIGFIQIDLEDTVDDEVAITAIEDALGNTTLIAGSGRSIKETIKEVGAGSLRIMTAVAIAAMLIGVAGVINILIAAIDARRFEFGVIRSLGALPGFLTRIVLAEVTILAFVAALLGTALGVHAAFNGQRMSKLMLGIDLALAPPLVPILLGIATLFVLTLLATVPVGLKLASKSPVSLLAATRG